jgi:hypothetical protein
MLGETYCSAYVICRHIFASGRPVRFREEQRGEPASGLYGGELGARRHLVSHQRHASRSCPTSSGTVRYTTALGDRPPPAVPLLYGVRAVRLARSSYRVLMGMVVIVQPAPPASPARGMRGGHMVALRVTSGASHWALQVNVPAHRQSLNAGMSSRRRAAHGRPPPVLIRFSTTVEASYTWDRAESEADVRRDRGRRGRGGAADLQDRERLSRAEVDSAPPVKFACRKETRGGAPRSMPTGASCQRCASRLRLC